jgi:hypothetical protein
MFATCKGQEVYWLGGETEVEGVAAWAFVYKGLTPTATGLRRMV